VTKLTSFLVVLSMAKVELGGQEGARASLGWFCEKKAL